MSWRQFSFDGNNLVCLSVKNWFLHLRFRLTTATLHRTVQTEHLVTSRFNFSFCQGGFNFEVHHSVLLLPSSFLYSSFLYSTSSLLCAFPLFYSSPSIYPAISANSPVFPTFIVQFSFPSSSSSTCGLCPVHNPCLFLFLLSFISSFLPFRAHILS